MGQETLIHLLSQDTFGFRSKCQSCAGFLNDFLGPLPDNTVVELLQNGVLSMRTR